MPQIITRSEWGARQPKSKPSAIVPRGLGVHYSSGLGDSKADHSLCDDVWRGFQNMHIDRNGWADIAYNWGFCIHGVIFEGRGWGIRSAAFGNNDCNASLIAACFIGGDDKNKADVTPEAWSALWWLYDELQRITPGADIRKGHRDCKATQCPGDELYGAFIHGDRAPSAIASPIGEVSPVAPPPQKPFPRPEPYPWPGGIIKATDSNHRDLVRDWQRAMAERGWRIAVDGVYGPQSKEVCLSFQRDKRLGADGILGPQTWARTFSEPVT